MALLFDRNVFFIKRPIFGIKVKHAASFFDKRFAIPKQPILGKKLRP